jgi:hypothetical protein
MKTFEFTFADGSRMTGDGNDLAEGLHDAYRRNGFLPFVPIIEKTILADSNGMPLPPAPTADVLVTAGVDVQKDGLEYEITTRKFKKVKHSNG